MKRYVLDCSVSMAWFLEDEGGELADRSLDILKNGEAVVPSFWVLEMANAFLVAQRRKRISSSDVAEAMELLADLPITVHAESRDMMAVIHDLASQFGISSHDACYLDLAQRLKLPLASLDEGQRKAAVAARVNLI